MMLMTEIAEAAVTLVASGYAVTKVLSRNSQMGIVPPTSGVTKHLPLPAPVVDTLVEERRLAQLFIDVPSAFWLDPNRYGDDPDWRKRLFPEPTTTDDDNPDADGETFDDDDDYDADDDDDDDDDIDPSPKPPKVREIGAKELFSDRRNKAWERRAAAVWAGTAENHGSCPGDCGFPVDKVDGWYRCSRKDCDGHKRKWR